MKKNFTIISVLFSITPLFSQVMTEVQYFEKDYNHSGIGGSISVSDSFAFVGSEGNDLMGTESGCVYIYKRTDNQWVIYDSIRSQTPKDNAGFGFSIEMNEEFAFIGAIDEIKGYGSVDVIKNNAGVWTHETVFNPLIEDSVGFFGFSVDISDTSAIVGTPGANVDNHDQAGAVYFYSKRGGVWNLSQKIVASDPDYSSFFGYSVSIMNGYALVGAYGDNTNGSYSGAVYVFKCKDTTWTQIQVLTPSDAAEFDRFGYSVDHYDNYAIIGAYTKNDTSIEMGSAYIFEKVDTIWQKKEKLSCEHIEEKSYFGSSVKINSEFAVVGAPGNEVINIDNRTKGFSHLFKLETGNWSYLLSFDQTQNHVDRFGSSIGLHNDYIFIGTRINVAYMYYSYDVFYIYNIQSPVFIEQNGIPSDICPDSYAHTYFTGENIDNYQWQVSPDSGKNYFDLSETFPYSGTNTDSLIISNITNDLNNYQYRCHVSNLIGSTYTYSSKIDIGALTPTIECRPSATLVVPSGDDFYIAPSTIFEPSKISYCGEGVLYNNITLTNNIIGSSFPIGDTTIIWTIISGDGDSASCSQNVTVLANSIIENNEGLHVFPNPCTDLLNINFQNFEQGNIQVFDLTGKNLKNSTFKGLNNKIDITDLKSGLYLIRIDTGNEVFNMKICKN